VLWAFRIMLGQVFLDGFRAKMYLYIFCWLFFGLSRTVYPTSDDYHLLSTGADSSFGKISTF
jgi:hypothetical protein